MVAKPAGARAPSAVAGDSIQLRQFVQWLAAVAFAFASAGVVAYVDAHDPAIAAIALVNAGFGCCLLLVGNLGVGTRIAAAAGLAVALGFLVIALAISVALPEGVTALAVLPMLAVAVALRSTDQRVLLRLLVVGGAAGLLLGVVGEVAQRQSAFSDIGLGLLRLGGQAMAVVLIIYSLWQFSGLLRHSLDRVREANAALQEAQGGLTSANDALRRHVSQLELRNLEMTRLVELGELLSSSQTSAEVAAVISRVVPPMFAGDAGAFYEVGGGNVAVEAVAVWGDPPPASARLLAHRMLGAPAGARPRDGRFRVGAPLPARRGSHPGRCPLRSAGGRRRVPGRAPSPAPADRSGAAIEPLSSPTASV